MRQATQRVSFTIRRLNDIEPPATGRIQIYDEKVRDLGLRVDANGRKSFYWYKFVNGKPVFRALGLFDGSDTSIANARDQARQQTMILSKWRAAGFAGENPFEPEAKPQDGTFQTLIEAYIEKQVANYATHPDKAEKSVRWMCTKYLPGWGERKLSSITSDVVSDLHHKLVTRDAKGKAIKGKVMADRVVQMLRRVFQWGIDNKKFVGANPAKLKFYGWTKRKRFLNGDELARLFEAMAEEPGDICDFVMLALTTGARRSDIQSMRWQDVRIDGDNRWDIPNPKGGEPYSVPLTDESLDVLRRRRRYAANTDTWVFPSPTSATGHLVEPKKAWATLIERAGIKDIRIHDLRRTLGSWQAGLGTSLAIIGRSLGHADGSGATAVYARLDLTPVRASMSQATAAMLKAASKPKRALKA